MHTAEKGTVTSSFAKALRDSIKPMGKGGDLILRHSYGAGKTNGSGEIVIRHREWGEDGETETRLPVESSIDGYGPSVSKLNNGFAMRSLKGGTIGEMLDLNLRQIRKGDVLRLRWIADRYTNGYCTDNGDLHADAVYIMVERGDNTVAAIHVETSVCKNNSARLVRESGF